MAVTNTDDHLRNHAFLLTKNGLEIIPLYDVNQFHMEMNFRFLLNDEDNSISVKLAIRTAPRFGVTEMDGEKIVVKMLSIIRNNWEQLAKNMVYTRSNRSYEACI